MSYKRRRQINKLATVLEHIAVGIVNGLELVVNDLVGAKRPHHSYTRVSRTSRTPRIYRQQMPVVVFKVVMEMK